MDAQRQNGDDDNEEEDKDEDESDKGKEDEEEDEDDMDEDELSPSRPPDGLAVPDRSLAARFISLVGAAPQTPKPLRRLHVSHLLQMVLQDAQTRLFFKAQATIQSDIRYFAPSKTDLDYPGKLIGTFIFNLGNSRDSSSFQRS